MSFPRLAPLGAKPSEVSRAINYLLGRKSYLTVFAPGVQTGGALLLRLRFPEVITLVADSSLADAGVATTADAVFPVKVDGVSVGTVTFMAGQADGIVAFTDNQVPANSLIEIYAPGTADATLADISLSIAAIG